MTVQQERYIESELRKLEESFQRKKERICSLFENPFRMKYKAGATEEEKVLLGKYISDFLNWYSPRINIDVLISRVEKTVVLSDKYIKCPKCGNDVFYISTMGSGFVTCGDCFAILKEPDTFEDRIPENFGNPELYEYGIYVGRETFPIS